jgi:hypothetical protein
MKLSVLERLAAGNSVASKVGKFETLRIIRKGREALSFTPEELTKLNLQQTESTMKWNIEGAEEIGEVDIPLDPFFIGLVKTELIKLNDKEELPDSWYSIYEKFVLNSLVEI